MFSSTRSRALGALAAASVLAFGAAAAPASAATHQEGLVNVSVSDVNVPIGIAANVCNVSANVLSSATGGPVGDCTAVSAPTGPSHHRSSTSQEGLVNIAVSDVNIPIGVAANVCNVSVNALSTLTGGPLGDCSAVALPTA